MNNPPKQTYPQSHQATPKGQDSPILQVTQLDDDSFRVDLPGKSGTWNGMPQRRKSDKGNLGLATNFCSKEAFFRRYDLVGKK
jgi:hypothetical protein